MTKTVTARATVTLRGGPPLPVLRDRGGSARFRNCQWLKSIDSENVRKVYHPGTAAATRARLGLLGLVDIMITELS